MALVFKLATFDKAWSRSLDEALERLNAGFFIDTDQALALQVELNRTTVVITDCANLLFKLIVNLGIEPVTALIRMQIGFFLKSDLHCVGRPYRRCRV